MESGGRGPGWGGCSQWLPGLPLSPEMEHPAPHCGPPSFLPLSGFFWVDLTCPVSTPQREGQ